MMLRGEIALHVRIAVQMVGGEVQPDGDPRLEAGDGLKLEGTHFDGQHVIRFIARRDFTHGQTVVATGDSLASAVVEHALEEFSGGGLAVGTGDGGNRGWTEHPPGKFNFANNRDAPVREHAGQGPPGVNARTSHHQAEILDHGSRLLGGIQPQHDLEILRPQLGHVSGEFGRITGVKDHRPGTELAREPCRSQAAAGGPKDGDGLTFDVHGRVSEFSKWRGRGWRRAGRASRSAPRPGFPASHRVRSDGGWGTCGRCVCRAA